MMHDKDDFEQTGDIGSEKQISNTKKPILRKDAGIGDYLDIKKTLLKKEALLRKLRLSPDTYNELVREGLFLSGALGTKQFVVKESFLKYLNSVHFEKRTNDDDPLVYNRLGKLMPKLTVAKKQITEIPDFKPTSEFAERIGFTEKSIVLYCTMGTFSWYRISGVYRISEEDWEDGLYRLVGTEPPVIDIDEQDIDQSTE